MYTKPQQWLVAKKTAQILKSVPLISKANALVCADCGRVLQHQPLRCRSVLTHTD